MHSIFFLGDWAYVEKSVQIIYINHSIEQVYRTVKTDQVNLGNNDNIDQSSGYIA